MIYKGLINVAGLGTMNDFSSSGNTITIRPLKPSTLYDQSTPQKKVSEIVLTYSDTNPKYTMDLTAGGTTTTVTNNFGWTFILSYIDTLSLVGGKMYGEMIFDDEDDYEMVLEEELIYPNTNLIITMTFNSSKKTVSKDVTIKEYILGKHTNVITFRTVDLQLKEYTSLKPFNYVFIADLNRYYYVKEVRQLNEFATLTLTEDVLMSWGDLIRSQAGFVERNENSYDVDKIDDLVEYDFDKSVLVTTITPTNDIYNKTATDSLGGGYFVLVTV